MKWISGLTYLAFLVVVFLKSSFCWNRYSNYPAVPFSIADAVKSDVTYQLFSNKSSTGIYLNEDSASTVINPDIPIKIILHGWLSNETTYWYAPYRDEEFKKKCNTDVIYIDWSKAGNRKNYYVAAANTKPVGEFIGDFIISAKVQLNRVHLIGHSLGSQVAGFVGKRVFQKTGSKIGRITATDPTGVGFENIVLSDGDRLTISDADFIDVIHTDIDNFGYVAAIGHADFYPNNGTLQPGCPPREKDENCSHARSNFYFIESVNSDKFLATLCDSWDDYVEGRCGRNEKVVFGENVSTTARGTFYLRTNSASPYAMGR